MKLICPYTHTYAHTCTRTQEKEKERKPGKKQIVDPKTWRKKTDC